MSFSSDQSGEADQLPLDVEFHGDETQFRDQLNDLFRKIATTVNAKEGGLYIPEEKITSQQYFDGDDPQNNRNVYRMVVDFGALPNSTSKSVPHNIDWSEGFRLTRIYGGTTDPNTSEGMSLPNQGIMLKINSTDVTITTTIDYSGFTSTSVVIEYYKG